MSNLNQHFAIRKTNIRKLEESQVNRERERCNGEQRSMCKE